jgi:hypothetical protein
VIAYVETHCHAPIWLVGTSRGTISAANVEARLGGASIAGVISTSGITVDPNAGTHQPSMATLYDGAGDRFTGVENLERHFHHAPITTLAQVSAAIAGTSGNPCGPVSYHGYWKLDDDGDVVPAIIRFVQHPG